MVKLLKNIPIILLLLMINLQLVQSSNNTSYASDNPVEYWAVVIGVADYQYMDPPPLFPSSIKGYDLAYSSADAMELAAKLGSIWDVDHIKLLVDSQATKLSIQNAITGWLDSKEDENDIILFYFSGHSWQSNTHEYIMPYNSLVISRQDDIQDITLNSWLNCLESNQQIVIIDSCNSGGFVNELYRYGRAVLTSCKKYEDSYEYAALKHSVFTYYILDALNNLDGIDKNNDGGICIEEVFDSAESNTRSYSGISLRDQHPGISNCAYESINLIYTQGDKNTILPYISYSIIIIIIILMVVMRFVYLSMEKRDNIDTK
ncbi:MAG: caspase family protein [Dehalococcoidia bacterium]|nr:MAG: caspase family protein [Dehalococcoidia bacterium]